jgi:hypothetical protein
MFKFVVVWQSIIVSVLMVLISIVIYIRDKNNKLYSDFAFLNFCIGMWCLGAGVINIISDYAIALNIQRICYFFGVLLIVAFIKFTFNIINSKVSIIEKNILGICTGILVVFLPSSLFIKNLCYIKTKSNIFLQSSPGIIYYFFIFMFFLTGIRCLYLLYRHYKTTTNYTKNQTIYFFLAYGLAFIGGLVYFLTILKILNIFTPSPFIVFVAVCILLYAIVNQKILDIKIMVSKIFIFLTTNLIVVITPFVVTYFFRDVLFLKFSVYYWLIPGVLTIFSSPTVAFIYLKLQFAAERKIFKQEYKHRDLILKVSNEIIQMDNVTTAAKYLTKEIYNNIDLENVTMYAIDHAEGDYHLIAQQGKNGMNKKIKNTNMLINVLLIKQGKTINLEEIKDSLAMIEDSRAIIEENIKKLTITCITTESINPKEALKIVQDMHVCLIRPLIFKGELLGFITFGRKPDKKTYTDIEIQAIDILASKTTIMIRNVLLFDEKIMLENQKKSTKA